MTKELKKCPFCGNEQMGSTRTNKRTQEVRLVCEECEAEGPLAPTETRARTLWNCREVL